MATIIIKIDWKGAVTGFCQNVYDFLTAEYVNKMIFPFFGLPILDMVICTTELGQKHFVTGRRSYRRQRHNWTTNQTDNSFGDFRNKKRHYWPFIDVETKIKKNILKAFHLVEILLWFTHLFIFITRGAESGFRKFATKNNKGHLRLTSKFTKNSLCSNRKWEKKCYV